MPRRKEPVIAAGLLDRLLAGTEAAAALDQGGLLDSLKKALAHARKSGRRLFRRYLRPGST